MARTTWRLSNAELDRLLEEFDQDQLDELSDGLREAVHWIEDVLGREVTITLTTRAVRATRDIDDD